MCANTFLLLGEVNGDAAECCACVLRHAAVHGGTREGTHVSCRAHRAKLPSHSTPGCQVQVLPPQPRPPWLLQAPRLPRCLPSEEAGIPPESAEDIRAHSSASERNRGGKHCFIESNCFHIPAPPGMHASCLWADDLQIRTLWLHDGLGPPGPVPLAQPRAAPCPSPKAAQRFLQGAAAVSPSGSSLLFSPQNRADREEAEWKHSGPFSSPSSSSSPSARWGTAALWWDPMVGSETKQPPAGAVCLRGPFTTVKQLEESQTMKEYGKKLHKSS